MPVGVPRYRIPASLYQSAGGGVGLSVASARLSAAVEPARISQAARVPRRKRER
jgi:hypothetical protein